MIPMQPFKLIAADMDGTLFTSQHTLSPRTEAALRAATDSGIPIVIATGRARSALAVETIEHLGLQTPGIFLQGTAVHNADGSLLHSNPLDAELAATLISLSEAEGYYMILYSGTRLITIPTNPYIHHVGQVVHEGDLEIVKTLRDVLAGNLHIHKIALWDRADRLPAIRGGIAEQFGAKVRLVEALPASLLAGGGAVPAALEMLPPAISKGTALAQLLREDFHLSPEEVIAFGDGENDLELLQVAGFGVAMGNANPVLKAAADHITASNDEDGLALAIEKFVLGQHHPL
jgi:Cof subfamily protein (haloacid dehalogenase superfamily)